MSEYYTPNIEDFHVGYEYECLELRRDDSKIKDWVKWKLLNSPTEFKRILDKYFNSIPTDIRVPYLTKEQIEREGWKETSEYNYKKINSNITMYYGKDHYLWIMHPAITELGEEYKANSFKGNCPSINEFRIICKLLNIK